MTTASGLVVICLDFAVALLQAQYLARSTDRWNARLWAPGEDCGSITARRSVGLAVTAAFMPCAWVAQDADRLGSALRARR
ncbi:hypothetical protein [Streptomyces sp. BA2]|uniref:hypothetical protein n=1 Tax=Streptomyces sp. BA2 TaxID=436595 RepID=UPI0013206741|nr:hypothetical protein [Streptomyces sp. BA2]MWA07899.1 hypothetical protein [Streptomyces sp. BA2]